jgi:hypothetical protein
MVITMNTVAPFKCKNILCFLRENKLILMIFQIRAFEMEPIGSELMVARKEERRSYNLRIFFAWNHMYPDLAIYK